jgi:hypothetical protein
MSPRIGPVLLGLLLAAPAPKETGKLALAVHEKEPGRPVPCRVHLQDPAGKPVRAPGLPFWNDHFVCPGTVELELPPGRYAYEIERGPEYGLLRGAVTVRADATEKLALRLERLADLAAEGWWSGELHVHRPPADVELLMRAEDLHIAPVITWWNNRNLWDQQPLPTEPRRRFDGDRCTDLLAGEDEREGGALLFFHLPRPLAIAGAGREYPSPMRFVEEARRHPGAWIDVEKPFWWDVPVWLASGQVDSIGLANNHMCRSRMLENEAWGKPRVVERLPNPHGNGYWSQEIYYRLLDAGLRVPPSAGSASGVLPNPVGYNRVYVHLDRGLNEEAWCEGLRTGRSFVTNGPLLRVEADGRLPGHVFTAPEGPELTVTLKARLTTRDPVRHVEVVQNGQVVWRVPAEDVLRTGSLGRLTFRASGWFLVRAVADVPHTFRFASTAPYYVELGPAKRRVSKAAAEFFRDWVRERMKRVKLTDAAQREEVLKYHRQAERFWEDRVSRANAD